MLTALGAQDTAGRFMYSIVVAANDQRESARAIVDALAESAAIPMRYCVEPRQNIALARNHAVENRAGASRFATNLLVSVCLGGETVRRESEPSGTHASKRGPSNTETP